MQILLIALGGALGSVARYAVGTTIQRLAGGAMPWGTVTVNLVGSFLIAVIVHGSARGAVPPEARLFLATGIMGGFTTYSSFNHETIHLLQSGSPALAALNVCATVLGCLLAGGAGLALGRALFG